MTNLLDSSSDGTDDLSDPSVDREREKVKSNLKRQRTSAAAMLSESKASSREKALKIRDPTKLAGQDLDTIIEYMKLRHTDDNIIKIKEELIGLKNINDIAKNSLISHSQLNKESQLLADRVQSFNPLI